MVQPFDPMASRQLDAVVIAYEAERDPLLRAWLRTVKTWYEDRYVPPFVPEGRPR